MVLRHRWSLLVAARGWSLLAARSSWRPPVTHRYRSAAVTARPPDALCTFGGETNGVRPMEEQWSISLHPRREPEFGLHFLRRGEKLAAARGAMGSNGWVTAVRDTRRRPPPDNDLSGEKEHAD